MKKHLITIICWTVSVLFLRWTREWIHSLWWKSSLVFPAPSQVFNSLSQSNFSVGIWSQATTLWNSVLASLYRVLAWLWLWTTLAIIIWSIMSTFIWIKRFILPIIQLLAPLAPIAWISIALVLFGIWNKTAIFIVFMWVFFFMTLITVKAIESIPEQYILTAKNVWYNWFKRRYKVILPSITPTLIIMLRINFMAAWMAVLAAEMTWLRDGLWAIIMTGRNLFDYELILFWMILIAIIWFIVDVTLLIIQRKYFWRDKSPL